MVGEMLAVEICQMYGWTYQQYTEQPIWFIDLIIEKIKIDRKKANSNK